VESEGGAVRLVTTGLPDAQGKLQGALQIGLKPGWKTYWRDPGEAGIPPSLDASQGGNVKSAELAFPPPRRIDDGYADTAGYAGPVALPVTFTMKDGASGPIKAHVFLGICKTICVPVQAELTVDPGAEPDDPRDALVVTQARAALPDAPSEDFTALGAHLDGDVLTIEARLPADAPEAQFFLASGNGYLFGLPEAAGHDNETARFTVKVFEKPEPGSEPSPAFDYTLVAGDRAVAGKIGIE
jgi:DsbC/DsbD-like thiol-disulfide interchange protein